MMELMVVVNVVLSLGLLVIVLVVVLIELVNGFNFFVLFFLFIKDVILVDNFFCICSCFVWLELEFDEIVCVLGFIVN